MTDRAPTTPDRAPDQPRAILRETAVAYDLAQPAAVSLAVARRGATADGRPRPRPAAVLALQRTVGNASVQRLLRQVEEDLAEVPEEAPGEEPTEEPTEEPALEPIEAGAEEASGSGAVEEAPAEEIGGEAPATEPAEEAPVESAPDEAPVEQPAEEAPTGEPSEEATPAESAPEEPPTDETAEETPAEAAPEETPSEQPADDGQEVEHQEQAADETPEEPASPDLPGPSPDSLLIVEDWSGVLEPGQMKKSAFLAALREAAAATANEIVFGAGFTIETLPVISFWFDRVGGRSGPQIEHAIKRYAPETAGATSAEQLIPAVCNRVAAAVRTWSDTGEVVAEPNDFDFGDEEVPVGATGVQFKFQTGADLSRALAHPLLLRGHLGEGQSLDSGTHARMSEAFGEDFGAVRVHTDTDAAGLNVGLGARAFTVGEHVAFGGGEYQPGSMIGDALIAHELAHVVQQRGAAPGPQTKGPTGDADLEEDADRSAVAAVSRLWGGAKGALGEWAQTVKPNLRAGLRLQAKSCLSAEPKKVDPIDDPVKVAKRDEILNIIGNPVNNKDAVIKLVDGLGDDGPDVVGLVVDSLAHGGRSSLAGSEAGSEILERLKAEVLKVNDFRQKARADLIDEELQERGKAAAPKVTADDTAAIDRINNALKTDGKMADYGAVKPPLRLPVTAFPGASLARDAGVYYDPKLPGTEAGLTTMDSVQFGLANKQATRKQYTRIFIRLGPAVLTLTDEYIRTQMFHEFNHYKHGLSFREPEDKKSAETKALENEYGLGEPPSGETDVITITLVEKIDKLNAAELKDVVAYLGKHFPFAIPAFKDQAIDRVKKGITKPAAKNRLIAAIDSLDEKRKKGLQPIRDAVAKP